MNHQFKKLFTEVLGVKVVRPKSPKDKYHFYTTAKDVFTLFEESKKNHSLFVKNNVRQYFDDYSREKFCGISPENFVKAGRGEHMKNMEDFLEAKKNLSTFTEALQKAFEPVANQRKRRFSEYDGEFSLDRQWEQKPFQDSYKLKTGMAPTMKINVDFCFSAYHSAEAITRYGAFCWAIFSKLEEAGISCEVNILQENTKLASSGKMAPYSCMFYTNIKKAGEYIDENALARCFTAGFFRCGTFLLFEAAAEIEESKTAYGLGHVGNIPFKCQDGEITLTWGNQTDKPEKLAENILSALKSEK